LQGKEATKDHVFARRRPLKENPKRKTKTKRKGKIDKNGRKKEKATRLYARGDKGGDCVGEGTTGERTPLLGKKKQNRSRTELKGNQGDQLPKRGDWEVKRKKNRLNRREKVSNVQNDERKKNGDLEIPRKFDATYGGLRSPVQRGYIGEEKRAHQRLKYSLSIGRECKAGRGILRWLAFGPKEDTRGRELFHLPYGGPNVGGNNHGI